MGGPRPKSETIHNHITLDEECKEFPAGDVKLDLKSTEQRKILEEF